MGLGLAQGWRNPIIHGCPVAVLELRLQGMP